ncbi:MAG TPA: hypothetical protein VJT54_07325 [Verrucomicrobiae bacterium]|nr:hypothetical protein [Verrucomicrobiae bacterium]
MRYLKVILGIGCFVLAIVPGGFAVLGFANLGAEPLLPFCLSSIVVVLTVGLVGTGCFLITQRNSTMSPKARVLIVLPAFCIGLFAVVVVPNFIKARSTSAANACINNLRQIDAAVKEYELQRNAKDCINNLRLIDAAKKEWVFAHNGKAGDVVTEQDLIPYIKLDSECIVFPQCPSGGTYTIGKIGEPPTCSLGTNVNLHHVLQ